MSGKLIVCTPEERAEIQAWAMENCKKNWVANGKHTSRYHAVMDSCDPPPPDCVWEIKKRVVEAFGLEGRPAEPLFRDFCSVHFQGGMAHLHLDPNTDGLVNTRFNVMIQKPQVGGMPVNDGKNVTIVQEGEAWRVDSGITPHCSTMVKGPVPRIILSFGFLLEPPPGVEVSSRESECKTE